MSLQFNLLPDVKLQHVQAERTKRLVMTISLLVSGVAVGILVLLLLTVHGLQKAQLSSADKQLKQATSQLKNLPQINKILTVQNQLTTLSQLHSQKHILSRIFTYLPQLTPSTVHITSLSIDTITNTMVIQGTADSQTSVNTFIDTLKFTKYTVGSDANPQTAFPSVVESSFGIDEKGATYSLTVQYDPKLFQNNLVDSQGKPAAPKLVVPSQVTTRSIQGDPSNALFNGTNKQGGQ